MDKTAEFLVFVSKVVQSLQISNCGNTRDDPNEGGFYSAKYLQHLQNTQSTLSGDNYSLFLLEFLLNYQNLYCNKVLCWLLRHQKVAIQTLCLYSFAV